MNFLEGDRCSCGLWLECSPDPIKQHRYLKSPRMGPGQELGLAACMSPCMQAEVTARIQSLRHKLGVGGWGVSRADAPGLDWEAQC